MEGIPADAREDEVTEFIDTIMDFYRTLRQISKEIETSRDRVARQCGVTGAQLYVFWNVRRLHRCTYTELAKNSGLSPNTVSGLVRPLIEKNWLRQSPDPRDGRITYLEIGNEGSKLIKDVITTLNLLEPNNLQRTVGVLREFGPETGAVLSAVKAALDECAN